MKKNITIEFPSLLDRLEGCRLILFFQMNSAENLKNFEGERILYR